MLTAGQLAQVRLIAGLYPDGAGWLEDADIHGLADFIGANASGVYDATYDRRLAVECLRVGLGRGIPDMRAESMRQRIVELLRRAPSPAAFVPDAPGGGGLSVAQVQGLIDQAISGLVTMGMLAQALGQLVTQDNLSGHAGLPNVHHTPPEIEDGGGVVAGISEAEARALIAPFARAVRDAADVLTYDVLGPLAPDTGASFTGRLPFLDQNGLIRWFVPVNPGFHSRIFVEPTPAQVAPGGNLATNGGVVFVQPSDNHPTEIWVRYSATLPLVLFHTLADPLVFPSADGSLPAATDFLGRVGIAGNHFYRSVGEQGSDKRVTFKDYGPDRVVLAGEPAKSADELLYAGAVAAPRVGNFVLNAWSWDYGSEIWIRNLTHNGANWVGSAGPPAYHRGNLYQTDSDAAVHVPDATYLGRVYIIGHGSGQRPRIVTGYAAPVAPYADWIPIGVTIQDIAAQVSSHDAAAGAHLALFAAVAAGEFTIPDYSADAEYSLGGSNTFAVHGGELFAWIHGATLAANHDPAQHPNYWANLSRTANVIIVDNSTNTHFRRGHLIITHEDEVYLCTTNAQAAHARGLAYVKANSGIGGEFVNLTDVIPTLWEGQHVGGTTYPEGRIVKTGAGNNRAIWQALVETDTTPTDAAGDWRRLSPPEITGGAWRGNFSASGGNYSPGDRVEIAHRRFEQVNLNAYLSELNDGLGPTDANGDTYWSEYGFAFKRYATQALAEAEAVNDNVVQYWPV